MNSRKIFTLITGIVLFCAAIPAAADVVTLAPAAIIVMPADETGVTKVAVRYDLSTLPQANLSIDDALIDWTCDAVPSEERSEYAAYAASEPWSAESSSIARADEPTALWDLEAEDIQRIGRPLVRLDIIDLVRAWVAGTSENYGVIIETPSIAGGALTGELKGAGLVIRYSIAR